MHAPPTRCVGLVRTQRDSVEEGMAATRMCDLRHDSIQSVDYLRGDLHDDRLRRAAPALKACRAADLADATCSTSSQRHASWARLCTQCHARVDACAHASLRQGKPSMQPGEAWYAAPRMPARPHLGLPEGQGTEAEGDRAAQGDATRRGGFAEEVQQPARAVVEHEAARGLQRQQILPAPAHRAQEQPCQCPAVRSELLCSQQWP